MKRTRAPTWCLAALLVSADSTRALSAPSPPFSEIIETTLPAQLHPPSLAGDWIDAKQRLRNPDCCVVSISGLGPDLQILQEHWVGSSGGPMAAGDVDLRARVRVDSSAPEHTYEDCLQVCRAVSGSPLSLIANKVKNDEATNEPSECEAAVVSVLQELARGISALTEEANTAAHTESSRDVFLRVVRASSYKARDPMFHTDKAPLRGYVTLMGPGTDFMTQPCTAVEYMTLRSLGSVDGTKDDKSGSNTLRRADLLDFIVMKGDRYSYDPPSTTIKAPTSIVDTMNRNTLSWMRRIQRSIAPNRTSACVHRSPPAAGGGRRIILSFDLADGDDDREWYELNKKREWRSGMTQRKSHLVA